jgi:hypothetical protein
MIANILFCVHICVGPFPFRMLHSTLLNPQWSHPYEVLVQGVTCINSPRCSAVLLVGVNLASGLA